MIESPLHPLNGRFKLFLHSNFPIHNIRGKPNVLSCKLDMMNFDCPCLFSPPQTISTNQHVFVESATGGYFLLREETSILVVPSCTSQGGIACGKVGWMPRCSHIFARPVFCPWHRRALSLTWGFESEGGRAVSVGPRRHPWCSRCCQSAWTGSAARPWSAGKAAGGDAPGMSWMTEERRGKETRLNCAPLFVTSLWKASTATT